MTRSFICPKLSTSPALAGMKLSGRSGTSIFYRGLRQVIRSALQDFNLKEILCVYLSVEEVEDVEETIWEVSTKDLYV